MWDVLMVFFCLCCMIYLLSAVLVYEQEDSYHFKKELGKGAFGVVYLATKSNRDFAIKKVININNSASREVKILKCTEHEHIIKYVDCILKHKTLYIVMEYADQGTLKVHAKKSMWIIEQNVWIFFYQIASALQYLFNKGIIHRDIKPDNILGVTKHGKLVFKIADFGLAKLLGNDIQSRHYANTYCGTYCYMAPEVLNGNKYKFSADIWSFGAVISFVCNEGVNLFRNKEEVKIWKYENISIPQNFSSNLKTTVKKLLSPYAKSRPKAETLLKIIDENIKLNNATHLHE